MYAGELWACGCVVTFWHAIECWVCVGRRAFGACRVYGSKVHCTCACAMEEAFLSLWQCVRKGA